MQNLDSQVRHSGTSEPIKEDPFKAARRAAFYLLDSISSSYILKPMSYKQSQLLGLLLTTSGGGSACI